MIRIKIMSKYLPFRKGYLYTNPLKIEILRFINEVCQTFIIFRQNLHMFWHLIDIIEIFRIKCRFNYYFIDWLIDWLPGVNGRHDTNGLPVWVLGHEQTGVKPRKLQSALTPIVNKSSNTIQSW